MPEGIFGVARAGLTADEVIAGSVRVTNSVTTTDVVTIPAGRVWQGTVSVCAQSGATTSSIQDARVTTSGTGVVPAAGTVVAMALSGRDTAPGHCFVEVTVVAPAGNDVKLQVTNSTATTFSSATSATGVLL